MSKRELWEIVRADELKAGDAFAIGQFDDVHELVASRIFYEDGGIRVLVDETEDRVELDFAYLCDESVFRRVDPEFFVHAANHIIECREIVRRLAELGTVGDRALLHQLWGDADRLWTEMKGAGDE